MRSSDWGVTDLTFGDSDSFCIEVEPADLEGQCHLVFRANGAAIGRRDEYTLLHGCVNWARHFLAHSAHRVASASRSESPVELMTKFYDVVYSEKAGISDAGVHRLRDVHHMDDIGMESLRDKYSVILVQVGTESDVLVWRELNSNRIFSATMPFGAVDRALREFVAFDFSAWRQVGEPNPND
jgi:hypothetical protein